ncbi:MAG: hypothetical protein LAO55_20245 [Acidobacteriia bacterium]|nr:hypothetical protein [Terriglobia bacterium]
MLPKAVFDKSFLQGLNPNESLFFDKFFLSVLCPIFHVETLADLAKAEREARTREQEVGLIADKTPELNVAICANHQMISVNSFLGDEMPMDGRIPKAMGREVRVHGKRGVVYEPSPEEQAYSRWQQRRFLEVERGFAKAWRDNLYPDASSIRAALEIMGVKSSECKNLGQAKAMAEAFVASPDAPQDRINLAPFALGLSDHAEDLIYARWKEAGFPPLPTFAPYGAYVFTVAVFFHIAVVAKLLTDEHRMDMAYLYYLPFCDLFVSSDKAHRRCAELFMRANQEFVWGQDLKANLKQIVEYYLTLPENAREQGIYALAPVPPAQVERLVAALYDRYAGSSWREQRDVGPPDQTNHPQLLEAIRELGNLPTESADNVDPTEEVEMMRIDRFIRRKRGDFYQVRKDMPNAPI